jgi:CBS domain-containing membrane protein
MLARDLMTPSPATVHIESRLREALDLMRDLQIRHVPVVNAAREVVGMISDRDLAWADRYEELLEPEHFRKVLARPVAGVMSADVVTVDSEAEVAEVIDAMVGQRIGAVPVVNPEGRLVGIISYVDVLHALGKELAT